MKDQSVIRDERTVIVENSSYRWGYLFISFGLLVIVAVRGFFSHESNWDLMGLVILSGLVTTLYQGLNHILTRRWVLWAVLTAGAAALVALILVFFTR